MSNDKNSLPEKIDQSEVYKRAQNYIDHEYKIGLAYGETLIRSSLLLNGGALFAVPAFVGAVYEKQTEFSTSTTLWVAVSAFLMGVLFSASCAGTAFIASTRKISALEAEKRISLVSHSNDGPSQQRLDYLVDLGNFRAKYLRHFEVLSKLSWFSIAFSYLCFAVGICIFAFSLA